MKIEREISPHASHRLRWPSKWLLVVMCFISTSTDSGTARVPLALAWSGSNSAHRMTRPPPPLSAVRKHTGLFAAETESPVATSFNPTTSICTTDAGTIPETARRKFIIVGSSEDDIQGEGDKPSDATLETDAGDANLEREGDEDAEGAVDEDMQTKQRVATAAATLLGRKMAGRSKNPRNRKSTSVGARRVSSATRARNKQSRTSKLLSTVQTVAAAAADSPTSDAFETTNTTASMESESPKLSSASPLLKSPPSKSVIQSAIKDLLKKRDASMKSDSDGNESISMNVFLAPFGKATEQVPYPLSHDLLRSPMPGTVLLDRADDSEVDWSQPTPECLTIRLATLTDDMDIANLRLSVFSDFSTDVRKTFVSRSCHVLASRRLQGATCLVAAIPTSTDENTRTKRSDVILGSAECSIHEFAGTKLGYRRPDRSVLYVTEVAVSPAARRCGVGSRLMEGVDELASRRSVETLYLHVDVLNAGALELYRRAGYEKVNDQDPIYEDFTTSLNLHDGATKGRRHYLLQKHLTTEPTWLAEADLVDESPHGTLGFEILV